MRKALLVASVVLLAATPLLSACAAIQRPYHCSDPLGCLEIPSGGVVVIGTLLATSGDYASVGLDAQRGIALAITDQGLIRGHVISLDRQGTDCSLKTAGAAATMLTLVAQMVAVIGPTCTDEIQSTVPILTNAGLVVISPSAGGTTSLPGFYRSIYPPALSGEAAQFAIDRLAASRAITITDHLDDSDIRSAAFAAAFLSPTGASRQVVGSYEAADFLASLPAVVRENPDVIYISASPVLAGQIVAQLKSTPGLAAVAVIGSENLFSPDFLASAGEAARGVYLVGPDIATFSPTYPRFLDAYAAQYAQAPVSADYGFAYDAVNLLIEAIRRASLAEADGTLIIPRQGLRQALDATRSFPGLTGKLHCTAGGDCAAGTGLAVYRVVDPDPATWDLTGNPELVLPLSIAP